MKTTVNKWFALSIVLTAPLLYVIDIFIINIAIPTIKTSLHATDGEVQLVILLNVVLNNISEKDAGAASGIFSTFQQTASALGISIIGGIFYAVLESYGNSGNYLLALQVGLSIGILCLIFVWIMLY